MKLSRGALRQLGPVFCLMLAMLVALPELGEAGDRVVIAQTGGHPHGTGLPAGHDHAGHGDATLQCHPELACRAKLLMLAPLIPLPGPGLPDLLAEPDDDLAESVLIPFEPPPPRNLS